MTDAVGIQLAHHDERIKSVEKRSEDTAKEVRNLKNWIMASLFAAVLHLASTIIGLLPHSTK